MAGKFQQNQMKYKGKSVKRCFYCNNIVPKTHLTYVHIDENGDVQFDPEQYSINKKKRWELVNQHEQPIIFTNNERLVNALILDENGKKKPILNSKGTEFGGKHRRDLERKIIDPKERKFNQMKNHRPIAPMYDEEDDGANLRKPPEEVDDYRNLMEIDRGVKYIAITHPQGSKDNDWFVDKSYVPRKTMCKECASSGGHGYHHRVKLAHKYKLGKGDRKEMQRNKEKVDEI